MKKLLRGERGSSLVLTAVAMAALMGFAALAVDGGYLYYRHTQVQDLSDSAALAATAQLVMSSGDQASKRQLAFGAAVECVERNGYQVSVTGPDSAAVSRGDHVGSMSIFFPEASRTKVGVTVSLDVPLFFGPAISISSSTVRASSVAQLKWDGLVPVCFFQGAYEMNARYSLTLAPGEGSQGNYGFLDFKPPSKFQEYLDAGLSSDLDFQFVLETYTGVNTGQVRQAVTNRIERCTHGCSVAVTAEGVTASIARDCPRLVLIPVVTGFYELDGKGFVNVVGFVRFFIESYDPGSKILSGWCLGQAGPGSDSGGASGFAIREVKLVK